MRDSETEEHARRGLPALSHAGSLSYCITRKRPHVTGITVVLYCARILTI